jgi:3,2-trans-enoyl-CoA isomerase
VSTIDKSSGIKTISLNYKPVNALDRKLLNELHSELTLVHKNPSEIKGLVLKSSFPKIFSAGLDLKTLVSDPEISLPDSNIDVETMRKYKNHIMNYMNLFQECVNLLITLPRPSVAIVQGAAPAGGTVLSLSCDYRLGVNSGFQMGLTEVFVGMAPPKWVHQLAMNHLGDRQGRLAVTRGTLYKTKDALKVGYVDELVEEHEAFERAKNEILQINSLPPVAWLDAKLKSVENVVEQINHDALQNVVDSISGQEFQTICKEILVSLTKKKKE